MERGSVTASRDEDNTLHVFFQVVAGTHENSPCKFSNTPPPPPGGGGGGGVVGDVFPTPTASTPEFMYKACFSYSGDDMAGPTSLPFVCGSPSQYTFPGVSSHLGGSPFVPSPDLAVELR